MQPSSGHPELLQCEASDVEMEAIESQRADLELITRHWQANWRRHFRRCAPLLVLVAVLLLLASLFGIRDSVSVRSITSLWSIRNVSPEKKPDVLTECVFDVNIAASYLARGGLELNAATKACPEIDELKKSEYEAKADEIIKHHRSLKNRDARPENRLSAHDRLEAACDRAAAIIHKNQLLEHHLQKEENSSPKEVNEDLRQLDLQGGKSSFPKGHVGLLGFDVSWLKGTDNTSLLSDAVDIQETLCTADISGVIASFSWIGGYLSAAASECRFVVNQKSYCASDVQRAVAALSDIIQSANGIEASCTAKAKRVRQQESRRLAELPPDPEDELAAKIKEVQEKEDEDTERQALQAECGVNSAQGALFLGRAALELNGAVEHCPGEGEERLRCAVNAQGVIAAFAVAAHVLAEAAGDCSESMDKMDLDAYCAASISQTLHGTLELSAALVALVEECGPEKANATGYNPSYRKRSMS